jgi:hypothetical protein
MRMWHACMWVKHTYVCNELPMHKRNGGFGMRRRNVSFHVGQETPRTQFSIALSVSMMTSHILQTAGSPRADALVEPRLIVYQPYFPKMTVLWSVVIPDRGTICQVAKQLHMKPAIPWRANREACFLFSVLLGLLAWVDLKPIKMFWSEIKTRKWNEIKTKRVIRYFHLLL